MNEKTVLAENHKAREIYECKCHSVVMNAKEMIQLLSNQQYLRVLPSPDFFFLLSLGVVVIETVLLAVIVTIFLIIAVVSVLVLLGHSIAGKEDPR